MRLLETRHCYTRSERLSDAVIHVSGLVLVLIAVPVLITLAAFLRGDFTALFGISVYGAALAAMILFSALYNMILHPGWAWLLKRLDHSAIYVKIAGDLHALHASGEEQHAGDRAADRPVVRCSDRHRGQGRFPRPLRSPVGRTLSLDGVERHHDLRSGGGDAARFIADADRRRRPALYAG